MILALSANAKQVKASVDQAVNEFAARGFRSLGVARAEGNGAWQFLGVLPLFDPPRVDAKATIATARQMGVEVKMVTGDALAIAVGDRQDPRDGHGHPRRREPGRHDAHRDRGDVEEQSKAPTATPRCSRSTSTTSWTCSRSGATSSV